MFFWSNFVNKLFKKSLKRNKKENLGNPSEHTNTLASILPSITVFYVWHVEKEDCH